MEISGEYGVKVPNCYNKFCLRYFEANILLRNRWNSVLASRSNFFTAETPGEIFETEYFPLDDEGCPVQDAIRIFDLRRSRLHFTPHGNIHAPENSLLNIKNATGQIVAPTPVNLFRRMPIDWQEMRLVQLPLLTNAGGLIVIVENDSYPIDRAEHQKETSFYNKNIIHGLRAKFLRNALAMQQHAYGYYKSPFEHPQNPHITKFQNTFNFDSALKTGNTFQWLANLDGSLRNWAVSVTREAQMEVHKYIEWMNEAVEGYRHNLKLQNKSMWCDDKNEPHVYIDHLHRLIDMMEMVGCIQQRTLRATNKHLTKAINDLALVLEKTLKRFVEFCYNGRVMKFFSENGQLPGERVTMNEIIIETKECYFCFNENSLQETNSLWSYACGHTYYLCHLCVDNENLKDCPVLCPNTGISKRKIYLQVNNLA